MQNQRNGEVCSCGENCYDLLLATFMYDIQHVYCIYHAVHYILTAHLLYNWKFVPFDCLHPIFSPSTCYLCGRAEKGDAPLWALGEDWGPGATPSPTPTDGLQ